MRQQVLAKGYAGGTPLAIKNRSICKIQPYLLSCNILEKFIKLFSTKKKGLLQNLKKFAMPLIFYC